MTPKTVGWLCCVGLESPAGYLVLISIGPCQWRLSCSNHRPLSISRPRITKDGHIGPRRRAAGRPLSGRLVHDSKRPLCGIHIEPRVTSTAGAREVLWDWAVWRLDQNHLIRLLPAHLLHIGWDAKTSEEVPLVSSRPLHPSLGGSTRDKMISAGSGLVAWGPAARKTWEWWNSRAGSGSLIRPKKSIGGVSTNVGFETGRS